MFGIEQAKSKAMPGEQELAERLGTGVHKNFTPEMVERALWEVACQGGNVARASRVLEELGVKNLLGKPIRRGTIDNWVKRTFRNRYHEILRAKVEDIDELISVQAQQQAVRLDHVGQVAAKQTLAGIGSSSGVEASQILRNVSQARASEIDKSLVLRGADPESRKARSLDTIAKELAGLGPFVKVAAESDEGIIDAEVVEGE